MTTATSTNSSRVALLRLLATTDLHSNVLGYDYYAERPDVGVGLSRVAALIRQSRSEVEDLGGVSVLLDNGDAFQGAPIGETGGWSGECTHPMITAFSVLNYDAIGLGNHDFNFGLPALSTVLSQASCPVICSNMVSIENGLELPFVSEMILEKDVPSCPTVPAVKIGILSVLPPQTVKWDSHLLSGKVTVEDAVQTVAAKAKRLKSLGCDIVVALAHTGLGDVDHHPQMENALYPIAAIGEVDAIVAGHTHLVLPDAGHGFDKPVVMPGAFGSHLGQIDLFLHHDGTRWHVENWDAVAEPIAQRDERGQLIPLVDEDPQLIAALSDPHVDTIEKMREPVGSSAAPLHSFFTLFGMDRGLALAGCAQAAAVRPHLMGTEAGDLPLLSAVAPGKFGGRSGPDHFTDIPSGALSMRNVADLQIFPNQLWAVIVEGRELREWLEMSAGLFNQIPIGSQDVPLVNAERAGHNFDVLFGLTYKIDISGPSRFSAAGHLINPEARRIHDLNWQGMPVADDQKFVVAVNSYRASGGGNFKMVQKAQRIALPPIRVRKALRDYIAGGLPSDLLTEAPYPWELANLPDTEVIAFTGPGAQRYLDELPPKAVRPGNITPNGFLELQLELS